MRTLRLLLIFGSVLTFYSLSAQSGQSVAKDTLNKGTINEQIDFILRKSSNFKNYKVIKRVWLHQLKKHINDSLTMQRELLTQAHNKIAGLQEESKGLASQIDDLNKSLDASNGEKTSIDFLGMRMEKQQYKMIMWIIIVVLLLALLFFIYSYKNSHKVTKESLSKLKELEEEYSGFRSRALEREQALNRKLLDEINKHKQN